MRHRASVLITRHESVLLIERRKGQNPQPYYVLCGGGIESGETAEQAIRREVMEELGVELTSCHLVAGSPFPGTGSSDTNTIFTATITNIAEPAWQEDFKQSATNSYAAVWLPLTILDELDIRPGYANAVIHEQFGK